MAKTMKAAQVARPGGPFELVERPIPEPGAGQVRIRVEACGICHSDVFVKEGGFPGISYPRVPGHEVAGKIDAVGAGVTLWKPGARVGVGWHGGHCFQCDPCRRGDFVNCRSEGVTGLTHDGGYAEYMVAPQESLARMPDELGAAEAGPLCCAGITVFNALRNSGARAGDTVAVQGIGGLGHLAIQFASKMGFRTVAISGGPEKQNLAHRIGAHHYIDASAGSVAEQLKKLGGARIVLATAPDSAPIAGAFDGLAIDGKVIAVGVGLEAIAVSTVQMIMGRRGIQGWPSGTAWDTQETLAFSALSGVRPMIETYPLDRVAEAYDRMMSNRARFRVVLKIA